MVTDRCNLTTTGLAAQQFTFTVSGITNGACSDCAHANGTWILTYDLPNGPCFWSGPQFTLCGHPGQQWVLEPLGGGGWSLGTYPNADMAWTNPTTAWDGLSPLTLTLFHNDSCSTLPATITIYPYPLNLPACEQPSSSSSGSSATFSSGPSSPGASSSPGPSSPNAESSSSSLGVALPCCPGAVFPEILHVTLSNFAPSANCTCYPAQIVVQLTYSGGFIWSGSFLPCSEVFPTLVQFGIDPGNQCGLFVKPHFVPNLVEFDQPPVLLSCPPNIDIVYTDTPLDVPVDDFGCYTLRGEVTL